MIDIFRNPAYQLFLSIKKVMCDVISDSSVLLYLFKNTYTQKLSNLLFNVATQRKSSSLFCLLTTLTNGVELIGDHYSLPD